MRPVLIAISLATIFVVFVSPITAYALPCVFCASTCVTDCGLDPNCAIRPPTIDPNTIDPLDINRACFDPNLVPTTDPNSDLALFGTIKKIDGDPNDIIVECPSGELLCPIVPGICLPSGTAILTEDASMLVTIEGTFRGRELRLGALMVRETGNLTLDRLLVDPATESVVTRMKVALGEIRVKICDDRADYSTDLKVATPNATASVGGTDFVVSTGCLPYDTIALIDDGIVTVDPNEPNLGATYVIGAGQRILVAGSAVLIESTTPLFASPRELEFGDVLLGSSSVRVVTFYNRTGSSILVSGATIDGVPIAFGPLSVDSQSASSLSLQFTPDPNDEGPISATLDVFFDQSVVSVPIFGAGAATIEDCDGNGRSDGCDPDFDRDGVIDACDNCPNTFNPGQENIDGDAFGDVCDGPPGDADNDGDIDLTDLSILLGEFGCTAPPATVCIADTDGDNDVDLSDLSTLLGNFGS